MANHVIKKLGNGFIVAFVPHRSAKSVTLQLRGFAGSNFEKTHEFGAAHLVEHMSLQCPGKDALLSGGAQILGVTSRDDAMFMVKVLKKDFSAAVDYLYEVFMFRGFTENLLKSQKGISEEEEKRFLNIPEKLIGRISYKLLYPNHRMSEFNIGSLDNIRKISLGDIITFKDRLYKPENFTLTVSGDLTARQVVSRSSVKFGAVRSKGKKKGMRKIVKLLTNKMFRIQNIISRFYSQTHMKIDYYGFTLSDRERFSSAVLAKNLDNYLKGEIKNKRGFSYNVGCASFSSHSYGVFSYYFASDKSNVENILKTIINIDSRFSEIASADNVRIAKNQLLSEMEFAYEKTSYRAEYYSNLVLQGLYKQPFSYELGKIENVSFGDLYGVFKKLVGQKPKITVLSDTQMSDKITAVFRKSEL